jgi:hypothetical protein
MKHTPPTFKDFILALGLVIVWIVALAGLCEIIP